MCFRYTKLGVFTIVQRGAELTNYQHSRSLFSEFLDKANSLRFPIKSWDTRAVEVGTNFQILAGRYSERIPH